MARGGVAALGAALLPLVASGLALADNPDCETFVLEQPDAMITNVQILYTWDESCGPDPELGPLERDGDPISVTWDHNLETSPHEHEAWDNGIQPGVHTYDLTVTVDGQEPYVLDDSLLVSGTAPAQDASPDSGGDADGDADADSDGDSDDDSSGGGGGGGGGCSVAPREAGRGSLLLLMLALLS